MNKIETEFTRQFNVDYPVIAAPMFLVSSTKLVVASSNAGGVGTFPALNYRPIENYRKAIQEIKKQTDKAFGINIIVQQSNKFQHEQIDIALEEEVPLIITSLGSPKEIIKKAHQTKTKVYCDVVGLTHAQKVSDAGADGVIAVSYGAGGHAGTISPFALIPQLVKNLKIPVVAAGSIVDGIGMAGAFALGAQAIYMGTRFIASKECEADLAYKHAIVKALSEDIINTDKVDGFPGNFIFNETLEKIGIDKTLLEEILSRNKKIKRWISLSRAAKSLFMPQKMKANYKTVFSAGHGVCNIEEILSVKEIINQTVSDYLKAKENLP